MDTNFLRDQDASSLVILPGLMCDSRMFPGCARRFAQTVFADGFYAGANRIEDMASATLRSLPARFALLGHSMGARVAIEIWRQAPERVERLALVDTGTHPVQPGEREQRHALRDIGRQLGFARLVDEWLPPMLAPASRANRDLVASLEQMVHAAGQDVFERQIEALLSRPDAGAILPTITCPTFVIVGEHDSWSPVAQHRIMAENIPGAQLRVIPGAGHMAPAEAPSAFFQFVDEWLCWQPQIAV